MKGLSLWQPWASLVAVGAKTFETRSWKTDYRGSIAIHASKKMTRDQLQYALSEPIYSYLLDVPSGEHFLPRGAFVAIAKLVDIHRTEDIKDSLSEKELLFGDYSPGRFAWQLENVQMIKPLPEIGVRRLWWVTLDIAEMLESRVITNAR